MSDGKRIDGELYWPFRCPVGHEFDLGPIHAPDQSEPDPEHADALRSIPGSGLPEHVPAEAPCQACLRAALDGGMNPMKALAAAPQATRV